MKTRINRLDADARTVDVTFSAGGVKHRRPVNACFDGKGAYDEKATRARIAEVARGVQAKIDRGIIA